MKKARRSVWQVAQQQVDAASQQQGELFRAKASSLKQQANRNAATSESERSNKRTNRSLLLSVIRNLPLLWQDFSRMRLEQRIVYTTISDAASGRLTHGFPQYTSPSTFDALTLLGILLRAPGDLYDDNGDECLTVARVEIYVRLKHYYINIIKLTIKNAFLSSIQANSCA